MKITAKEISGVSFHAQQQRGVGAAGGALVGSLFSPVGAVIGGVLGSALTSWIRVASYGASSEVVIGTTFHELAHAQHWRLDKSAYNDVVEDAWIEPFLGSNIDNPSSDNAGARRTLESYAAGIEVFLTNKYYRGLGNTSYDYLSGLGRSSINGTTRGSYQFQDTAANPFYTSAITDLEDNFNQREDYGSIINVNRPIDNVVGVPITTVERAMRGARNWDDLRERIIIQNSNGQAAEIRQLFNNW